MSTYCLRSDIEDVFGVKNVSTYADLDDDADAGKITSRIERAITFASAEIDDHARRYAYNVPLVDASGNTPTTIANLCAVLAGIWMYEARGSKDVDERTGRPAHRFYFAKRWAYRTLGEIRDGTRQLDALK